MRERKPATQTMNVTDARQQFSQLIDRVFRRDARILVKKSGIPVAAIISADDLRRFSQLETERAERFKALDLAREAFADVPDQELEREIRQAVAEMRRRRRETESTNDLDA